MGRGLAMGAALGAILAAGPRASAQDAPSPPVALQIVLEGRALRVMSGASVAVVELGCEGRASLKTGDKVFVACGADGVVEVDLSDPLSPQRIGRMAVSGDAAGLFLREGQVWVEIARVDAKPVRTDVPAPVAETAGVRPPPADTTSRAALAPSDASPQKPSLMAPPRRGGLWELSWTAGVFLNLGEIGGGGLGGASAVYRFDAPIVVRAELAQLGVGIGHSGANTYNGFNYTSTDNPTGSMAVAAAHLLVGLDTRFVEVALGGGGATIAAGPANGGVSIVQEGRLGARDGLAFNAEIVTVAANDQFQLGSFVGSLQVPVTPSVMLMARGGLGGVGPQFGDLGGRFFLRGDGGPGTIALLGYFGGAGIDFGSCVTNGARSSCKSWSLGGPSLGGGVEWRL